MGINNAGQMVGSFDYGDNAQHGFIASPIPPADFERPGCCTVDPNWKEE